MKSQIFVSLLIVACVGILAGCGQSKAERQRDIKAVQDTKQKSIDASVALDAVNQKIAGLNSDIGEQEKTIQGLNDSVTAAEASNAAKQAQIDRLMNPEETALADADAAYQSGDNAKALAAYKAFARDFPFSSKVAFAQDKAKKLQGVVANQARQEANAKVIELFKAKVQAVAESANERVSESEMNKLIDYVIAHPNADVKNLVVDAIVRTRMNNPIELTVFQLKNFPEKFPMDKKVFMNAEFEEIDSSYIRHYATFFGEEHFNFLGFVVKDSKGQQFNLTYVFKNDQKLVLQLQNAQAGQKFMLEGEIMNFPPRGFHVTSISPR